MEDFTPSVIEPSFGVGRVMYSLFEHNFKIREGDEQRVVSYMSCEFNPLVLSGLFCPFEFDKSIFL